MYKCLDDRNYHLQNVKLLYTRVFSASRFLACTYVFLLINETDMQLVKAKKDKEKVEHNIEYNLLHSLCLGNFFDESKNSISIEH